MPNAKDTSTSSKLGEVIPAPADAGIAGGLRIIPVLTQAELDQRRAKESVLEVARSQVAATEAIVRRLEEDLGLTITPPRVELVGLLREVEWEGDLMHHICPVCKCSRMHGHQKGCRLAVVVGGAK